MKSILNRATAVIAVAVLGGCAETMLTQPADALQSVTNQIIKEQNMQEQTAPQKGKKANSRTGLRISPSA